MNVEIVTIGDELLLGFTIDTNAAHLARDLSAIGIGVPRRTTVGDTPDLIVSTLAEAMERTGGVITTGGLGPTADDRTREAVARLFGRALRRDDAIADRLRAWWTRRGLPGELPASNLVQAMVPDGARVLPEPARYRARVVPRGCTRPLGGDASRRAARDAGTAAGRAAADPAGTRRRPRPVSSAPARCVRPASPNRRWPTGSAPYPRTELGRRSRLPAGGGGRGPPRHRPRAGIAGSGRGAGACGERGARPGRRARVR